MPTKNKLTLPDIRMILIIALSSTLIGCVYLRLLEFRRQLADFDNYFTVDAKDDFTLIFNKPVLYRRDFDYLSKLQPSLIEALPTGKRTHYLFTKIDSEGKLSTPPVELRMTLNFNQEDLLVRWTHSPEFLAMVPPEFLAVSLRSLGSSSINRSRRQVRGDLTNVDTLDTQLPNRRDIEAVLGDPIETVERQSEVRSVYRFKVKTKNVKAGYEDRQFTTVKLDFDPDTFELVKMAGRFIGVKLSVDYRKLQKKGMERKEAWLIFPSVRASAAAISEAAYLTQIVN